MSFVPEASINAESAHPAIENYHEFLAANTAEFRRIMRLKQHQRAVIRERLHHPLIAIAAPPNQIAPPLVSGFMGYNLLRHCQPVSG